METLSLGCKNLQVINISNNISLTDATLISLAKHCTILRQLIIEYGSFTDEGLQGLAKHARKLEILDARSNRNITSTGLEAAADFIPTLHTLHTEWSKKTIHLIDKLKWNYTMSGFDTRSKCDNE